MEIETIIRPSCELKLLKIRFKNAAFLLGLKRCMYGVPCI